MTYRLLAEESIELAVRRIACEQVDRSIDEARATELSPLEAVHKVRKRCKRIRSLLRLVRTPLQERYSIENAWYRDAARALAHVRDARVVLDTFDALLDQFEEPLDRQAFMPLRADLERRRKEAASNETAVRRHLRSFRKAMQQGRGRVSSWRLDSDGFDAIRVGLTSTYRRGRRAMRVANAMPSDDAMHEWRKRVKDDEHHTRLLQCVWQDPMKARRNEADALGDLLGEDHDLSVLRERLVARADVAAAEALRVVLGLIGRRQIEVRATAEPLGARLYGEKPKQFASRIEGYWDAWRTHVATAERRSYRAERATA